MNDILERPSMVLLIDCWSRWDEPPNNNVKQCYQNIKNFCETNTHVHSVGLATYFGNWGGNVLTIGQEEPWYSNSQELFHDTTRWEKLRSIWTDTKFDQISRTHPIVRDLQIREDQTQFLLWDFTQLLYYCNHVYPIIENIYVLGIAFNTCLESRPIGWRELAHLNQYSIFSKPKTILSRLDCSVDLDKNFVTQVDEPWKKLYNNTIILDQDQL